MLLKQCYNTKYFIPMGNYLGNSETMTTKEASDILGTSGIVSMLINCICKACEQTQHASRKYTILSLP